MTLWEESHNYFHSLPLFVILAMFQHFDKYYVTASTHRSGIMISA